MKSTILFILLLCSSLVYSQQSLPSLNDDNIYGRFVNRSEMWLCTSLGFPVDISYDAFHVYYSSENGTFTQVMPGKPDEIIKGKENISGIFNVTGRSAGVYEFLFTSSNNDFCGMSSGMQSVVRVYLVPDLRPFTVLSNLCGGENDKVNLLNFVPFEVKNFADSMGWKINFFNLADGGKVQIDDPTKVEVALKDVGTRKYSYRYDDSQGPMKDGLKRMEKVPAYCCADSAIASINVKIHGDEFKIEDREVSFCLESLASVPHNIPSMHVNLMSFLGVQAKNGVWELDINNSIKPFYALDDPINGLSTINIGLIQKQAMGNNVNFPLDFKYIYKYKNCSGEEQLASLSIKVTDKLADLVIDKEKTVCRNLTSGSIDLDTYFNFYVPTTAGSWFYKDAIDNEIYMPTSSVYIDTLKAGSLYHFVYRTHSVAEQLCDLQTQVANFSLRIRDINFTSGGSANMCRVAYKDPSTNKIDLFSYLPGFTPDKVDYDKVSWYSCNSYGESNLPINPSEATAYNPLDDNDPDGDLFVRSFKYEYESECGKVEGKLFLSIVDSIFQENYNRNIVICYTDDWASDINLNRVFGIAGLKGDWVFAAENLTGLPNDPSVWTSPIFNAQKAYEYAVANDSNPKDDYTFIFKYTPKQEQEECLTKPITVTVVVTKEVNVVTKEVN